MTEPVTPDPSNSPPDAWLGDPVDDSAAIELLLSLTAEELALGADLDRAEGNS
jgi:hypothetical protein